MIDHKARFTLRTDQDLLEKLGYVAEYEGRTKNRELEQLIKRRIREFESMMQIRIVGNAGPHTAAADEKGRYPKEISVSDCRQSPISAVASQSEGPKKA